MKDISMKVKGKTIIIGKSKTKVKNIKMVKLHKEDDRLDFYIEFIQKALDIPALHEIACGNNIPILRSSRIIKAWILNCYPKEKKKNEYHVRGVRLLTKVGNYLYKEAYNIFMNRVCEMTPEERKRIIEIDRKIEEEK